jgi:hypothetical protein
LIDWYCIKAQKMEQLFVYILAKVEEVGREQKEIKAGH